MTSKPDLDEFAATCLRQIDRSGTDAAARAWLDQHQAWLTSLLESVNIDVRDPEQARVVIGVMWAVREATQDQRATDRAQAYLHRLIAHGVEVSDLVTAMLIKTLSAEMIELASHHLLKEQP